MILIISVHHSNLPRFDVMGASFDLLDVSVDIYLGKCRTHSLTAVFRDEWVTDRASLKS